MVRNRRSEDVAVSYRLQEEKDLEWSIVSFILINWPIEASS